MLALTRERLRAFAPMARADIVQALVDGEAELASAGLTTPLRLQHFLAQVATETGGLRLLEENLTYSAERLVQVWPGRFPNLAAAKPYARNPQKLAGKVYGSRLGNRSAADGWTYRGSGMLQTTGRENFTRAGHASDPETLRQPAGALTSALHFWVENECNSFADRDDLTGLRKRINGGSHGLSEARNYLSKAKKIIVADEPVLHARELPANRIRVLQQQLVDLGYKGVRAPDGVIGPNTIGAISAFQAENGLVVNGQFDAATEAQLFEAQPTTQMRDPLKTKDSRILSGARTLKRGATAGLLYAGVDVAADPVSGLIGLKSKFDQVKEMLSPLSSVKQFLTQHWIFVVIALAAGVYLYGRNIEQARLEDHESGAHA